MRPEYTCLPGDIWCKCAGCRYLMSYEWAIPEALKQGEFFKLMLGELPPIPVEATVCPFCGPDGACGREWCPYTKES